MLTLLKVAMPKFNMTLWILGGRIAQATQDCRAKRITGKAGMLAVDIAGSTDQELQRIIGERCAHYGVVVRVRVHVSRINSPSRPCAIVDMATPEQAKCVADFFAATSMGKSVVILLGPKPLSANHANANSSIAGPATPEPRPKTMFQLLARYESQIRSR